MPSTNREGRNVLGSKQWDREGEKGVNLFDIELIFDEKERLTKARLEEVLIVVLENSCQRTAREEYSPAGFEGQEIVRSTVVGPEEDRKGHTIGSRSRQNVADVSAAIREGHEARAARRIGTQTAVVVALTNAAVFRKVSHSMSLMMKDCEGSKKFSSRV